MVKKRVVVKLGTSTLTGGEASLSPKRMFDIARQTTELLTRDWQVILVSSGAIRAGREALNFPELPSFVPAKQMLAAVGQPHLMNLYDQFYRMFNQPVAQVLLTREDFTDRQRFLNIRSTFEALLDAGIIPIVNENDTIATEEIRFGDNDNLSAQVANLVEADLLALLTDQKGLYTSDPSKDPEAKLVEVVPPTKFSDEMWKSAGGSVTGLGTGGMFTKLQAADLARRAGVTVLIVQGSIQDVLLSAVEGTACGTKFLPMLDKLESRKRYILAQRRTPGVIVIDDGASKALEKGGSLLPVGVTSVEGKFERGDTVRVVNSLGKEVAVGLVNYPVGDLQQLAHHRTTDIEGILGYTFGDEVIHHNNLFLL